MINLSSIRDYVSGAIASKTYLDKLRFGSDGGLFYCNEVYYKSLHAVRTNNILAASPPKVEEVVRKYRHRRRSHSHLNQNRLKPTKRGRKLFALNYNTDQNYFIEPSCSHTEGYTWCESLKRCVDGIVHDGDCVSLGHPLPPPPPPHLLQTKHREKKEVETIAAVDRSGSDTTISPHNKLVAKYLQGAMSRSDGLLPVLFMHLLKFDVLKKKKQEEIVLIVASLLV